jgi:hypothetical protein
MEHMFEDPPSAASSADAPPVFEVVLRSSTDWLADAPGGLLAMAVEDRSGRLGEVTDGELLRLVAATERLASWAQARQLEAIAELARRPVLNPAGRHAMDGRSLTIGEIGPALGLARHSATRRVDLAEHLTTTLPGTLAALRQGRIDPARAQVISDELTGIPDLAAADRAVIEHDALAAAAAGHTGAQVRDRIRRALLAVTPKDAAERHQRARRQRRVCTMPQPDGMGELWGYLPAETITMIEAVLNGYTTVPARTHPAGTDGRSRDERRADALADIFRAILDNQPLPTARGGTWTPPPLPTRQGRRPHLVITIAASTLAGTDNQPATLTGYGPVPADLARHLAADAATYQTACVDDTTGTCQWIGKTTPYRPAQWMVDQVIARDPACRHPGCRRPAAQCDVDHATRHPDGPTCPCNLMPLCAFHHHLKHDGGWTAERIPTTRDPTPAGTVNWTSPLGRTYPDPPVPLMPPAPRQPTRDTEPHDPPF